MAQTLNEPRDYAPEPYVECFGKDFYNEFKKLNVDVVTFIAELQTLILILTEINEIADKCANLHEHVHNRHHHGVKHKVDDIKPNDPNGKYSRWWRRPLFPIEGLLAEMGLDEDLDGNGKIFGKDFLINDGPKQLVDARYRDHYEIPEDVTWSTWDDFHGSIVTGMHSTPPNPTFRSTEAMHEARLLTSGRNIGKDFRYAMTEFDTKYTYFKYKGVGPFIRTGFGISLGPPRGHSLFNSIDTNIDETTGEGNRIIVDLSTNLGFDISQSRKTTNQITKELVAEIAIGMDSDGNGEIFGKTMYVSNDDPLKPHLLKKIERQSNYTPGLKARWVSWDHYLSTLGLGKYMKSGGIPPMTLGVIVSEQLNSLVEEVYTGVDVDGDGLVYGRDFVIFGPNLPTILKSKYPPLMPDIIISWSTYLEYLGYEKSGNMTQSDYAAGLSKEYDDNLDQDDNNKLYGVDFILDPNDPHFPKELSGIKPKVSGVPMITWEQYVNDINPPVYSCEYLEINSVKLIQEFRQYHEGIVDDVDQNGLIYGRDFLISDYDDCKVECLWRLEETSPINLDRDINHLEKIKQLADLPPAIRVDYTEEEFIEYWGTINPEVPVSPPVKKACVANDKYGANKIGYKFPKLTLSITAGDYTYFGVKDAL